MKNILVIITIVLGSILLCGVKNKQNKSDKEIETIFFKNRSNPPKGKRKTSVDKFQQVKIIYKKRQDIEKKSISFLFEFVTPSEKIKIVNPIDLLYIFVTPPKGETIGLLSSRFLTNPVGKLTGKHKQIPFRIMKVEKIIENKTHVLSDEEVNKTYLQLGKKQKYIYHLCIDSLSKNRSIKKPLKEGKYKLEFWMTFRKYMPNIPIQGLKADGIKIELVKEDKKKR